MDQKTQDKEIQTLSPPCKKKLRRCDGCQDLTLALEGVQDVERKEIRELEVRLKKIEVRQCRLLHIIIRCYTRMSELQDSLLTEARHVRTEIKMRKDALERLVSRKVQIMQLNLTNRHLQNR